MLLPTYASRTLTKSRQQCSTIQKECLTVVYAMKHFHHYLLSCPFQLITNHAPLQWHSTQKMKGFLCHWALAMEEYNFNIVYCKGFLNGNADALSHLQATTLKTVPMTSTTPKVTNIQQAQQNDLMFQQL